jgi:hypothetical protein
VAGEISAAVFTVIEAEEGPREDSDRLTPAEAEDAMATVRGTARETREEAAAPRPRFTTAA